MAMTAQGLMLSLAGVSVCADDGLPCPVEASGFDQGAEGQHSLSAGDPPAHAGALHALGHQGLVGRLDHRLSRWRRPLPSGRGSACAGGACGRRRVPVRSRPDPALRYHEGGATPGSPCRRHRGRDAEPRGTSRTSREATAWSDAVRRCSQACQKSMTSVSGDRVSRKVQLSAAASAIATILTSGRQLPDMCDFACELRLQCDLAALPACGRDRGSSDARPWRRGRKPCRRRPRARRPRHGRPRRPAAAP